MVSTWCHW